MQVPLQVSEKFGDDLSRAVKILQEEGCSEIFLFGSVARGEAHAESDLDLAVSGCPRGRFFSLIGRLLVELEHPVDLVNLDMQAALAQYLKQEGLLVKIA